MQIQVQPLNGRITGRSGEHPSIQGEAFCLLPYHQWQDRHIWSSLCDQCHSHGVNGKPAWLQAWHVVLSNLIPGDRHWTPTWWWVRHLHFHWQLGLECQANPRVWCFILWRHQHSLQIGLFLYEASRWHWRYLWNWGHSPWFRSHHSHCIPAQQKVQYSQLVCQNAMEGVPT